MDMIVVVVVGEVHMRALAVRSMPSWIMYTMRSLSVD